MNNIYTMQAHLSDKAAGDPTKMLAMRCLANMFKDASAVYALN